MYEHLTKIRVRYAETDQMGVVYYGNYAQYFEVGRAESIRELGFTYKKIEETGIKMPVVHMEVDYLRPAFYDELLTIKTLLKELSDNHVIHFYQEVYNESDKLITKGEVTLYFIDQHTGKKTSMPQDLRRALAVFFR